MYRSKDELNLSALSFIRGEEKGFNELFEQLYPGLLYYAFRLIQSRKHAENVVEDCFVDLYDKQARFETYDQIKSWLYRSVNERCINRRSKGHDTEKVSYMPLPQDNLIRAEVINELYHTIETLPSECRKIYEMIYIQGKSLLTIATELKISMKNVEACESEGLAILKRRYPME